jgi:hypothetical protein
MTQEQLIKWKKNAKKAGFKESPIYDTEPIETACKLIGHGFKIHIYNRPHLQEPDITGWGPDELQIEIPENFSLSALQENLNKCMYCGKKSEIVRLSFAGRSCSQCREKYKNKYELPGWTK